MRAKDGLGRYGERVAAERLVADGYELLDRNWRCAGGELDLVARRGGVLAFVEVKTRRGLAFGEPCEAVGPRKQRKLRELAAVWLREHPGVHGELSFDVISVLAPGRGAAQVTHLRQAF